MSSRPFAEATQAEIDNEVSRLLREAEERAIELLKDHRRELDSLVDLLLEMETVDGPTSTGWPGRPTARPSSRRYRRSPPSRARGAAAASTAPLAGDRPDSDSD